MKIRDDNFMQVEGKPFFPLFMWGKSDVVMAHDLGMNSVLLPWAKHVTPQVRELANRLRIRLIVG